MSKARHIMIFKIIYYYIVKKYYKVSIQEYSGRKKYRWATKMLVVAICMSLFFGFISQTLLSSMGVIIASICICVFIFFNVLFDMLGIAVASADIEVFEKWNKQGLKGAAVGYALCENSEKMCSFCADVVGDICSTLCGAGGACIVASLTASLTNANLIMFTAIMVSAIIAGVTIFFKAIMKERALKKSNKIILRLGVILESTVYREKKQKSKK